MLTRRIFSPHEQKLFDSFYKILQGKKVDIVELSCKAKKGSYHIELVISAENLTVDKCADITRLLRPVAEVVLDTPDVSMDVMSPGINRKLRSLDEFYIFINRGIRVFTEDGNWISGVLTSVTDESIRIEKKGSSFDVPVAGILKAKLDYLEEA
ncbi:hypothetical protein WKV44_04580 [Spirochaetia bacterium 38H-sp]|uniref:Ribosome maturation factor RimP n=1 Tax=Rarispira pelagica TaxID=3141764 RepID=A0ABU9UCW8_9SPIR